MLAALIFIGWLIAVIGDSVSICPSSIPSGCNTAAYYLAQNNAVVVILHQYYQIFTSILVTGSQLDEGALDAGFNAIAVLILDRLTEDVLDKPKYFLVFFLTAILGNLLTLLEGPDYVSAGASGGIFGIFAAIISFSWAREKRVDAPTLTLFLVIFFGSSILPHVNWVAHVGGALGGFIMGNVLYQMAKPRISDYSASNDSSFAAKLGTAGLISLLTITSIIQFVLFARG
ncbi:MAG: rhomboid family intramembrane serine protease [Nitrososphaerales archaeon]